MLSCDSKFCLAPEVSILSLPSSAPHLLSPALPLSFPSPLPKACHTLVSALASEESSGESLTQAQSAPYKPSTPLLPLCFSPECCSD